MGLLSISSTAQLITLFIIYRVVLPHLFSPVEWISRNLRFWLPEGTLQDNPTRKKKGRGKNKSHKSKKHQKANLLLFSNNLEKDQVAGMQGFAAVDWRFSMVFCATVLFVTSEICGCLFPEETTLEISTIMLCVAIIGCLDFLLVDLMKSDKETLWDHFVVFSIATFFAFMASNTPLVMMDFRFKHALRAGNHQYILLLHHLGLNMTEMPMGMLKPTLDVRAAKQEASTMMLQSLLFTFMTSCLAGFVTSLFLKPARLLAEAYVHMTDMEYTPNWWSRTLTHIDLLYPVLLLACWVPPLTADFFTSDGLMQCGPFSVLRDCSPEVAAAAAAGATTTGVTTGVTTGEDIATSSAWKFGPGITETEWVSIRTALVLFGTSLKLYLCRRNLQAYLDRARYQFDIFIASSGMATMERVRNVLQYRIRVICPNMLALFAPFGFPFCTAMLLKQLQNLSFHTCSLAVTGLRAAGWETVGTQRGGNGNGTVGLATMLLDDEGKESVAWFADMANSGRTMLRMYIDQMLSFLLFWSLASTFIMICFFILVTNRRFDVLKSPVTQMANTIFGEEQKRERMTSKKKQKNMENKKTK